MEDNNDKIKDVNSGNPTNFTYKDFDITENEQNWFEDLDKFMKAYGAGQKNLRLGLSKTLDTSTNTPVCILMTVIDNTIPVGVLPTDTPQQIAMKTPNIVNPELPEIFVRPVAYLVSDENFDSLLDPSKLDSMYPIPPEVRAAREKAAADFLAKQKAEQATNKLISLNAKNPEKDVN